MKVRFLADADFNKAIVNGLLRHEPSIDFLTAHAAGLRGKKDAEVLALTAAQGRALVSHHINTMPAHFRAFQNAGRQNSGLFLVHKALRSGQPLKKCFSIWLASEASEWENRLAWLPL